MDYEEFERLNQQFNGFERGQDRYRLINNLNYLTTFFIRDDVRDGIKEQVSQLSFDSDIQIRMCTGDSVQTATCIALQANIINEHEIKNQQYCVITGEQLMELTGEVNVGKTFTNRQTNTISAKNKETIKTIHKQIKVVARCTPEHKFALVSALQSIMGRVACTGESIGDVKALKWANVGLCMGSGCNVAKMAADIIIEEDQFKTIYRANQWGRNVSQSVRKFLQFQLTVNISACTFLVLSALIIGQTPFAIIQLLWINVVMDIFAALSLATEPPPKHQEQLSQDVKRIQKKDKIITVTMWKYIFGQVAYQQLIMLIFLFFGPMMFGESYNLWSGEDKDGSTESQTKHYTFLFALFMQMNLFNQMNARKVNDEEMNIFSNVHNNLMYILILIVEFFVVYVMVHYNPQVFSAAQISNTQHWIAFIFGVLSLAVGAGLKKVANKDIAKHFEKIPEDMDDEKLRQIKTVVDSVDKQFERSETQRGFDSAR
jgi:magnesium-transporting ATPase (P-type)